MSSQASGDAAEDQVIEHVDGDLVESARGVGADVEAVVKDKLSEYEGYQAQTVARFATAALRAQVEAAEAEDIKGIIMGSRDRHGKNWPRRHSILKSDGDHLEVSSWDGTIQSPSGNEVTIPQGGAVVQLKCDYDQEHDSYEAKRLDGAKEFGPAELVDNIRKVAVSPDALTRKDEYEVVVVEGTIRYVNPQTVFEGGDPAGDGQILMEDQRNEKQPHFEVSLEREGNTVLRGHVERQAYGRPCFQVPDLERLVADAASKTDDPKEQANFLEAGLQDMGVILVGNVNSYDTNRDGDEVSNYVDIGVTAMVAVDQPPQQTIDQAAEDDNGSDEGNGETDEEVQESPGDSPQDEGSPQDGGSQDSEEGNGSSTEDGDNSDSDDGDETVATSEVMSVREDIETYADITGTDIEDMTVSDVTENMDVDAPEAAVRMALDGEVSDTDAGPEEGSLEALMEPLLEGDTYNCPIGHPEYGEDDEEQCLAQAGSPAELLGHIQDDHGLDQPPEEFARDRMEG